MAFRFTTRLLSAKWVICCLLVAALPLLGCGDSGLPMVKVKGQVTFDGGPCPAVGSISFQPLEVAEGLPLRPGNATFDTDGYYSASSFGEGDGLVPGRYRIKVRCDSGTPNPASRTPWEDITYIAPGYKPGEIEVVEGAGAQTHDLDIPLKK